MRKQIKSMIAIALALALAFTGLFGIGAFFTGTDVKSDGYTIGQVEVQLVGDTDLYAVEKLTPNQEWDFTRSVKNIGINDAYVFMTVTVPTENIFVHDLDGIHTDANAALTQLFTYGTGNAAGVSSQWKPVTAGKYGDYNIQAIDGVIENRSGDYAAVRLNNTITYIYAYVGDGDTLARLSADQSTDNLFELMKFVNASDTVAQYNVEGTVGQVKTEVYAIQADNVLETTYMQGQNNDGSDAINAVWSVLNNATSDKKLSQTDDVNTTYIPVTSIDQNGVNLNATSTLIEGEKREELLYSLDQSGLANADEVDILIDVKADDFEDMADTTFDLSGIANEGDKVVILHYNEETSEWEYIAEEEVVDGKVNGDFSSYSPVAFVIVSQTKEQVEGTIAFVGLSYGIEMDAVWMEEWLADQGYTEDNHPDHVTINPDGTGWKSRAPIVNTIYAEHPKLKAFEGYKGNAFHGGFGSSYQDISVMGVGADGCVDYANSSEYRWNKYEVVSEDETSLTIKLICDVADFSNVGLSWECGHENQMTVAITDVKVENGALTGIVVLEKETGAPHYFFHHAALNMQVHPDYADLPVEPTPLASALRNDLGDILPNNTSVMPYGQAMAPNADWMIMDKSNPYGDMLSGNWTSYEVVAQDASTITLKLISNERDFSDVDLAYEGTVYDATGLAEIAIVDGQLTWTHTFEKKSASKEQVVGAVAAVGLHNTSAITEELLAVKPTLDCKDPYYEYVKQLHGGFGGANAEIHIAAVGEDGCVGGDGIPQEFYWNKFEVIGHETNNIGEYTVKLICDTADFSNVQLGWTCGHDIDSADLSIDENGALVWRVVLSNGSEMSEPGDFGDDF